jgi:hypothetical protein
MLANHWILANGCSLTNYCMAVGWPMTAWLWAGQPLHAGQRSHVTTDVPLRLVKHRRLVNVSSFTTRAHSSAVASPASKHGKASSRKHLWTERQLAGASGTSLATWSR